jgi:hypothetical protein
MADMDVLREYELAGVPVTRRDGGMGLGLRQSWVEIEGQEGKFIEADLSCGAGLGTPWLTLAMTLPDGTVIREVIDVRQVLPLWIGAILEDVAKEDTQ